MNRVREIAKKYNLLIIEDAAEAFGSEYMNIKVGSFGDVSSFSFYGNKTITTGEGGMIAFKEEKYYNKAKILRDHGMSPDKRYWHDYVGYNYRMTNMQAAVGYAQILNAESIISKKIKIANIYKDLLKSIPGINFQKECEGFKNTFWLVIIIIDKNKYGVSRDELIISLKNKNIDSRPVFYPLNEMPPYRKYNIDSFPNSTHASKNGLCLPSYPDLNLKKLKRICDCIISIHKSFN